MLSLRNMSFSGASWLKYRPKVFCLEFAVGVLIYCRHSEILRIVKEGRVFPQSSRFIIHLTTLSVYEIVAKNTRISK
jgi:hypothetical protein